MYIGTRVRFIFCKRGKMWVGTRGGRGGGEGALCLSSSWWRGTTPTWTGTRPPHPLPASPCPYNIASLHTNKTHPLEHIVLTNRRMKHMAEEQDAMQEEPALIQDEPVEEKSKLILRVENLSKSYPIPNGKLTILQDITLEVRKGEFIAITGQSGSGKTTLLSLLGALD